MRYLASACFSALPSHRVIKALSSRPAVDASVTLRLGGAHGSGFLISREGYLLTNAHVVVDATRIPVEFRNGVRVQGTVVRVAKARDVALVQVPLTGVMALPIRPKAGLSVADDVYVVGSPLKPGLRSTVSKGIVSAYRRIDGQNYIQSDAAITPGSSGGPLLDDRGNVVGIAVAGYTAGQNLNLFIPIDEALAVLNIDLKVE